MKYQTPLEHPKVLAVCVLLVSSNKDESAIIEQIKNAHDWDQIATVITLLNSKVLNGPWENQDCQMMTVAACMLIAAIEDNV